MEQRIGEVAPDAAPAPVSASGPVPQATTPSAARVFISYSRKDMDFADRLESALRTRRIEPLIDRSEIYAFEDWWKRIEAIIARADTVVFVISPDAVSSEVCHRELGFAESLHKRLAPVVCRRTDDNNIPKSLARLNFIFFDEESQFDRSADRLAEALQTDIAWIRKHTEYGEQARRWGLANEPSGELLRSPALEEAERWIAARPEGAPAPTEQTQAFIRQSRHAATRRQRWAIGGSLGVASLAAALAIYALVQRQEATVQRDLALTNERVAQDNERRAERERDDALKTQSRFLADLAGQRLRDDNAVAAMILAQTGLPDARSGVDRPKVAEAEAMLYSAKDGQQEIGVLPGDRPFAVTTARYVGKNRILTAPILGRARLWDAGSLKQIAQLGDEPAPSIPDENQVNPGWFIHTAGDLPTALVWVPTTRRQLPIPAWDETLLTRAVSSPDGRRIVTLPVNGKARLWDSQAGEEIAVLGKERDFVWSAAFSPDGQRFVTTSLTGAAELREAATGKKIAILRGHRDSVWTAKFSRDGRRIATVSWDNTARIWDGVTGQPIVTLAGKEQHPDDAMLDAAFSPDGRRLATASWQQVDLWDVEGGRWIAALDGRELGHPAFSPDGRLLLTTGGLQAHVWDAEKGSQVFTLEGHDGVITGATFSPDGQRILTASMDGTARIWEAATGKQVSLLRHRGPVFSARYDAKGSTVVTASQDGSARLWDASDGALIDRFTGHDDEVWDARLSPDGARILTASKDATARVWNVYEAGVRATTIADGGMDGIRLSPDGRRTLLTYSYGLPKVLDTATGRELLAFAGPDPHEPVSDAVFSPDGTRIAAVGEKIHIWDAVSGLEVRTLDAAGPGLAAAFSPDGRQLAVGFNGSATVWDVLTGEELFTLTGHMGRVTSVSFSPDGLQILTAAEESDNDGTARVWDAKTGKQLRILPGHDGDVHYDVHTAAFSSDGKRILTVAKGSIKIPDAARVWNREDGRIIGEFKDVQRASLSPDGKRIVTISGSDGRVFDIDSGRQLSILKGNKEELSLAMFSPDGMHIITASTKRSVRLWNADTGDPLGEVHLSKRGKYEDDVIYPYLAVTNDGGTVVAATTFGVVRFWQIFPTTQGLVDDAKAMTPRCLAPDELIKSFLNPEPPAWCIEMGKWPYQTRDWKDWLRFKRANANPPSPNAPDWSAWRSAHQ